jgi:hypothetical protein
VGVSPTQDYGADGATPSGQPPERQRYTERPGQPNFFGHNDLKKRSKTARIRRGKEILIHLHPLFIGVKRILSDDIKRVVDINRGKVR